jgi:hypothetical protein
LDSCLASAKARPIYTSSLTSPNVCRSVVCGHSSSSIMGAGTIPFNPAKLQFAPFNLAQTYFGGAGTTWNRAFFTPNTKGASDLLATNSLPRGLAGGEVIGPKGHFGKGNSYGLLFTYGNYQGGTINRHNGNFPFAKPGYLGYKFSIAGRDHFGWARLRVDIQKPHTVTKLLAFGYETVPGKAIEAGSCSGADTTTTDNASETHPLQTVLPDSWSDTVLEASGDELTAAPLGLLALGAKSTRLSASVPPLFF